MKIVRNARIFQNLSALNISTDIFFTSFFKYPISQKLIKSINRLLTFTDLKTCKGSSFFNQQFQLIVILLVSEIKFTNSKMSAP